MTARISIHPYPGGRHAALVVSLAILSGCAVWRAAHPPEWSARRLPDRPGVLQLETGEWLEDALAEVVAANGTTVVTCESVPCRAVVPPGSYRALVRSPGRGWYEAHGADVPVEIAPCSTERLRVALTLELTGGVGKVLRHDRIPLASDPDRVGGLPPGCAAPGLPAAPPPQR